MTINIFHMLIGHLYNFFGEISVPILYFLIRFFLLSCKSPLYQWSPTFLAPGTGFIEDNFSIHQVGGGGWFQNGTIKWNLQAHYIYFTLYFYYYYINSTSDHQALDPGGWRPLRYIVWVQDS